MDDDTPPEEDWAGNLANLKDAIAPFLRKFRNLGKVRERLLGDVADAGFDALVARLRLSQARSPVGSCDDHRRANWPPAGRGIRDGG